jgi:hypothetical protein
MIIVADQGVCVLIVVVAQVTGWNEVGPASSGVRSWTWRIVGNSLGSSVSVGIGWIRLEARSMGVFCIGARRVVCDTRLHDLHGRERRVPIWEFRSFVCFLVYLLSYKSIRRERNKRRDTQEASDCDLSPFHRYLSYLVNL